MISLIMLSMLAAPCPTARAQEAAEKLLPAPSCADGWTMHEKATLFDKDSLFDRINGESELYFPYGFTVLAYARYESRQNPQIAIDADIYAMGSLLDAFGMFAKYRKKDDSEIAVGGGGTVSPSQLLFYQDRYFVRLQVTGTTHLEQHILLSCAKAISKNLPQNTGRPNELDLLHVPAVIKKSERYSAQNLLGYDFFRRGLIADAVLDGERAQVFVVLEQSPEAARVAIDLYHAYLKDSGLDVHADQQQGYTPLITVDPLYGNVYVEQMKRYLIGVIRFQKVLTARQIAEQVRNQIARK
jgi:hypothetical protein